MTKNYHTGGRDERRATLAYLRRKRRGAGLPCVFLIDEIQTWILKRVKRYRAKKGGL